jgi:hypothetical protein
VDRVYALVERQLSALTLNRMSQDEVALAARALWSSVHGIAILRINYQLQDEGQSSVLPLMEHLISHYLAGFDLDQGEDGSFKKQVV